MMKDQNSINFINSEFDELRTSDRYGNTLVIQDSFGNRTKHIEVTNEELQKIRDILTGNL